MFENTAFRPPQPSTVIGLGVLAGSLCYLMSGDPVWAGAAAAAVKILVPDNSADVGQILEAITMLAQPVARLLRKGARSAPLGSGDQECNPQPICREPSEK